VSNHRDNNTCINIQILGNNHVIGGEDMSEQQQEEINVHTTKDPNAVSSFRARFAVKPDKHWHRKSIERGRHQHSSKLKKV
jgi:hypothetical protein